MSAADDGSTPSPEARPHPRLSVVIPVYNEEKILHAAVTDLRDQLTEFGWPFEIILAENGSRDGTVPLARALSEKYPEVRYFSLGEPNYGKALREGIFKARGEFVMCDEIDLCQMDFYRRALDVLTSDESDLVIGSKVLEGASATRTSSPASWSSAPSAAGCASGRSPCASSRSAPPRSTSSSACPTC
jgi:glycosyltransferase involved in cell wall biosynthesis